MKLRRYLFNCLLAGVIGLIPLSLWAQPTAIRVVTTFDYPGAGNSTTPFGINDRGDIAGDYVDSANVRRGFVRFRNGSFSAPIVAPGDTGNFTRARGINRAGTVTGDFFNVAMNTFHGYLLNGGVFTQFDFGGPFSTAVFGINDNGNLAGVYGSLAQPNRPFINLGGVSTDVSVPGAFDGQGTGINIRNRMVGSYRDGGLIEHGFIRRPDGALRFPIDIPGASSTVLNGINDQGWIVGRYKDGSGHEHGFFLKRPDTVVRFDFPNAADTSFNGINNAGLISGRYTDGAGLRHGFVARVRYVRDE